MLIAGSVYVEQSLYASSNVLQWEVETRLDTTKNLHFTARFQTFNEINT